MNNDQQTTVAGVVGALAIVLQWVAGKFNIQLGFTADVLNAITVLAGMFIAWKTGKIDANKLKLPVVFLVIGAMCFLPLVAEAQTWKDGNSVKVAWDAEPNAKLYKIYKKPFVGGTPETFVMDVLTGTNATVTINEPGKWLLGVSTVATVGGEDVESTTKCWSNDASCVFQGSTFGLRNIVPPSYPKNFRKDE